MVVVDVHAMSLIRSGSVVPEGDLLGRESTQHPAVLLHLDPAHAQLVHRPDDAGTAGSDHGDEAGAVTGDQERRHLPLAHERHVELVDGSWLST